MSTGDSLKPLETELAALLAPFKTEINEALAVRYLCLIGLSILIFDHCVTFSAERRLIWNAPRSIAKFGFLLNRYLVPLCLVGVFLALSGFYGLDLTDMACRNMFAVFSIVEMCSLALGNGLVAMRIVDIWDRDRRVAWIVFSGYAVAYATAIACYTTTLITRLDSITWNPLVNMCNLNQSSYLVIPAWAAPLAFEFLVLAALLWNNIDRPRGMDVKLAQALQEDGIMFYVIMTVLRFVELGLSATLNPRLLMLGAFFLWAMVTTTSSRSLLAWRRIEISESSFLPGGSSRNMRPRRGSPTNGQDIYPQDTYGSPMQDSGHRMDMSRMPMDSYLDRGWNEYKSHA